MAEPTSIGDKIPPILKPYVEKAITLALTAAVTAITAWLVGQGLLAPTNERLEAQTEQIIQQNKTLKAQLQMQRAEAEYWSIPVTESRVSP